MEKDDEAKGAGNSYDYKNRIQDPRLGRFLSVDPLFREYPWNSFYAFAENDVIRSIDLDGLEKQMVVDGSVLIGPVDIKPINDKLLKEKAGTISSFDMSKVAVFNMVNSNVTKTKPVNTTQKAQEKSQTTSYTEIAKTTKDATEVALQFTEATFKLMEQSGIEYGVLNKSGAGKFYKGFNGSQHVTMTQDVSNSVKTLNTINKGVERLNVAFVGFNLLNAESEAEKEQAKKDAAITGFSLVVGRANPLVGAILDFGLLVNDSPEVQKGLIKDTQHRLFKQDPSGTGFKATTIKTATPKIH